LLYRPDTYRESYIGINLCLLYRPDIYRESYIGINLCLLYRPDTYRESYIGFFVAFGTLPSRLLSGELHWLDPAGKL